MVTPRFLTQEAEQLGRELAAERVLVARLRADLVGAHREIVEVRDEIRRLNRLLVDAIREGGRNG